MRSRRDAAVLALLGVALVGLSLLVRPRVEDRSEVVHLSTYRVGPFGARALFYLMEELDIAAERSLDPRPPDDTRGALVLLAPVQAPTPREIEGLTDWIRSGGTLVYGVVPAGDPLSEVLGLQVEGLVPDTLGLRQRRQWSGVAGLPEPHVWAADLDPVSGFGFAFSESSAALSAGGVSVVLRGQAGEAMVIDLPLGAGRVVAWSDPTVLGNRRLREESSAVLFSRVVRDAVAAGGVVRFDEYHQGFREDGGIAATLWRLLTRSPIGRGVLQASAAGFLFLLLAGARFGRPLEDRTHWRRSPLEHVDAVATAYQRANARATARSLLRAGLDRRLGRRPRERSRTSSSPHAAVSIAAARLEEEWNRGPGGSLVELTKALDDYESEIKRWK
jgi:hypothetical protein